MREDRPFFRIPVTGDADDPWAVLNRLLATHAELATLKDLIGCDLHVAIMLRSGEWVESGRVILGQCHLMTAGAKLRPLFLQLLEDTLGFEPTFLILLSADWWATASAREREILVFHEALHADQARDRDGEPRYHAITGDPIPCIRPHDVEEFHAVARRYGAWSPDLEVFLDALQDGARRPRRAA